MARALEQIDDEKVSSFRRDSPPGASRGHALPSENTRGNAAWRPPGLVGFRRNDGFVANLVRGVVVNGAGISLASGIPTFRGQDEHAVWKRDVTELGTFRYFLPDLVQRLSSG